jgi:tRNA threonylcarbamoyladenosine modification (KEOPS) complex  Pcc1 subunit
MFLQKKNADCASHGLIGVDAILSRLTVEYLWWPSLIEKRLHYLAETWSRHDRRRGTAEISAEARKAVAFTVHHVDCVNEWELPQRYSSWIRLVRVTAYVLKFIKNSKREKNSQPGKELPIEVSKLRKATHRWFRLVQKAYFSKEWSALSKNEPIPKSSLAMH